MAKKNTNDGMNIVADVCSGLIKKRRRNGAQCKDIISFAESSWGMGMSLWPAQKFIVMAFYGMELDNTVRDIAIRDRFGENIIGEFTQKEFLQFLYDEGRCNTNEVEGKKFRELILVLGRGSGKTSIAEIIQSYEAYRLLRMHNPQEYYRVKRGSSIGVTSVSTSMEQAEGLFTGVLQATDYSDFLRSHKVGKTSSTSINFVTDHEKEVLGNRCRGEIFLTCSGCSGKAVRGGNNIVVIFDELAYFVEKGPFSAYNVYGALTPSVARFGNDGKIIDLSSPGPKYGQFYDLYELSWDEDNESMLMFKMPTAFINPLVTSESLIAEYKKNSIGYFCEFEAEFSERLEGWVDDTGLFYECVVDRGYLRPRPRTAYFMCIDVGLKDHGTAMAVAHKEGDKVIIDMAKWFYPREHPFEMFDVLPIGPDEDTVKYEVKSLGEIIKGICSEYPIRSGFFDQFNGYGLLNEVKRQGLKQFRVINVSDTMNSEMFQLFKQLWQSGNVELYNDKVIIDELLELQEVTLTRGRSRVSKPARKGARDDVSSAIVRTIWECFQANMGKKQRDYRKGVSRREHIIRARHSFSRSPGRNSQNVVLKEALGIR